MAGAPFLFISHSSADMTLTREVCEQLKAASQGDPTPYQVIADFEDLKPNMEWPRYLLEWMARCHAAVILLTEAAARSPWVLKEATILTARRSLDPSFKLFVVRFPGTDALLEQRGYAPLFLSMIQHVGSIDAEGIANAVRAGLGPLSDKETPFDTLVGMLSDVLERVGSNALKLVAQKLNTIPERLTFSDDQKTRDVETIARHLVGGHLGAFEGVHTLIDGFHMSRREDVGKLLSFASSYWIDPEAAGQLPPLLGARPRVAAALNGADVVNFLAPLYVRRAHPSTRLYTLIPVAGGWSDRLEDHVTNEICTFIRARRASLSRAGNDEVVAWLTRSDAKWYAALPDPVPDNGALITLLDRFPTVTFILATGEALKKEDSLTRVRWLEPTVSVERETRERDHYDQALDVLSAIPQ